MDKLGNYIDIKHGWAFKGEYFSDHGTQIVLTPANFYESGGFKATPGKEKYYLSAYPPEYLCKAGDLIVVMTQQAEGLLGATARVPVDNLYLHNQRIGLITVKRDDIDLTYIDYLMRTPWVRQQLEGSSSGSKVKHTSPEKIQDVNVVILPFEAQVRTGSLLSAIDAKIDNNKKLMGELEATARLIYDYWFTQFDFPDEDGKPYRSSGGKMVWSDELKREIPDGWQIAPVRDACSIIDCLHSKKPDEYRESESAYLLQLDNLVELGMLDLSWKYYVSIEDYKEWTSRIELRDGDMVITNAGRVGGMARVGQNVITGMGRNMTGIRPVSVPAMFMWYFFQSPEMQRQIRNNTDSGSFFGSLNVIGIKSLKFVLPTSENMGLLDLFHAHVEPLRRRAETLQEENLELMMLRDWLLPMLMNGQAQVED